MLWSRSSSSRKQQWNLKAPTHAHVEPFLGRQVLLNTNDEKSCSQTEGNAAAIMDLASSLRPKNLLLYGVQLHQSEVSPPRGHASRTGFLTQLLCGLCVSSRTRSSGGRPWGGWPSWYPSWSERGAPPWWVSFSGPEP